MIKTAGTYYCRDRKLIYGKRTLCMGILNVTPDSFSDGGINSSLDSAMATVEEMVNAGVDIIDVGGESTRPGYTTISDEEELSRIVPVISAIRSRFDVIISVDTYKSAVAKGALEAGAHIINDITGLMGDENMASVVADSKAGVILMFNARTNGEMNQDIVERAIAELTVSIDKAHEAGIADEYIMTDPGIGFGTTREQDMALVKNVGKLSFGKYPVLLAGSRKRLVAELMERQSTPAERDPASIALALAGISYGANAIRVHNVKDSVDAFRCYDRLMGE